MKGNSLGWVMTRCGTLFAVAEEWKKGARFGKVCV